MKLETVISIRNVYAPKHMLKKMFRSTLRDRI